MKSVSQSDPSGKVLTFKILAEVVSSHHRLLFSGLLVLLKQKLRLSNQQIDALTRVAAHAFAALFYGNV